MVETLNTSSEFEHTIPTETERKLIPVMPDALLEFREQSRPIEQLYLSHPNEPYSLRLREELQADGSLSYTATLKDRGELTPDGIKRLEVETEISAALYQLYKSPDTPIIRKLRADVNNHTSIDFHEDGLVVCEAEDPIALTSFLEHTPVELADVSGDRYVDNEWRAHLLYRRDHDGRDTLLPHPELHPTDITHDILSHLMRQSTATVRIAGRSGSGKSTIVRDVSDQLREHGIAHNFMSTDDYHRGKTWLDNHIGGEWIEWDAPIVYDTATMAADIAKLRSGESIARRRIDFTDVEPEYIGTIQPTRVLLIEGIYSHCDELSSDDTLNYRLPTPLATCVGRRILRDLHERPQFTAESNLRYMLEQAEPEYKKQVTPAEKG